MKQSGPDSLGGSHRYRLRGAVGSPEGFGRPQTLDHMLIDQTSRTTGLHVYLCASFHVEKGALHILAARCHFHAEKIFKTGGALCMHCLVHLMFVSKRSLWDGDIEGACWLLFLGSQCCWYGFGRVPGRSPPEVRKLEFVYWLFLSTCGYLSSSSSSTGSPGNSRRPLVPPETEGRWQWRVCACCFSFVVCCTSGAVTFLRVR